MSEWNRVIWTEGMFLRPQHYQQQTRFLESYVHQRCAPVRGHFWGFSQLQVISEQLALGKVALARAVGVFPDGAPFNAPEIDPIPAPLDIGSNVSGVVVYLGIPVHRAGDIESDQDPSPLGRSRLMVRQEEVRDSSDAEINERERVEVGVPRLRLLLETEPRDGYVCVGVCRITEVRPDRTVVLDRGYIPPVTHSGVDMNLRNYVAEVLSLMRTRGEALAGRVTDAGRGGTAEMVDFLLLLVVNRFEPLFRHYETKPVLHPEELFEVLVQLAGELAAFNKEVRRPGEFGVYIHDNLELTFRPVIDSIRQCLAMVLEQNAIMLPLSPSRMGYRAARVPDRNLLAGATFVLAAKADVPAEVLRANFPRQAKMGPVEHIHTLVNSALTGLQLDALPVAPRQLPYHSGFSYFEVQKHGDLWKQMTQSAGFGLHVGNEYPSIELELWAIKGG